MGLHHHRKLKRNKTRARVAIIMILAGVLLIWAFISLLNNLRPIVRTMAESRALNIASNVISNAITEQLEQLDIRYDDLVTLERDANGHVVALKTNSTRINAVRAQLVQRILEKLDGLTVSKIAVPLGNVINGELFSGRGPKIVLNAIPVGWASAEYENVFSSAGINQTRHQIVVKAEIRLTMLLSANSSVTVTAKGEVTIAETVIVGIVPGVYGQLTIDN